MSQDKALLVIDVQVGMFNENEIPYQPEELLKRIGRLLEKARAAKVPVIFVQHNEGPGGPLEVGKESGEVHPAIAPLPDEARVVKTAADSFYKTTLKAELEARGIKNLVICGLQTEFCVDTTTRRAFSEGYKVTLVEDAHSTYNTENLTAPQIIAHHNSILRGGFATLKPTEAVTFEEVARV